MGLKWESLVKASRGRLLKNKTDWQLTRDYFSKPFSLEFMGSITSFKSNVIKHDVHFINYGPY